MRLSIVVLATIASTAPLALGAQQARPADYADAMLREHQHDTQAASPAARVQPAADVTTEEVTYGTADGKSFKGFLARPAKAAKNAPGIVVVHEWWGLNDNVKAMAKRLAGEGYVALAVDLMGGVVATKPEEAMGLYRAAMADVAGGEKNVGAAIAYLKQQGATKIGTIGWCFGGHWSLRTGLVGGKEVQAVVMYYGAPINDPAQLSRLKAPLLGLFGGLDKGIPVDSVRAMESKLKAAGQSVAIHVYADANHAFANPTGQAYNAAAAEDAWTKTLAFYKAHLK